MKKIKIGTKYIGEGYPVFIIAEAGVNHNGKLTLAKKLVDAAKAAGADAVKFQTFEAEDVVTKNAPMAEYQERNVGKKETQQEMLKKLELKYEDFEVLKKYCDEKGIIFLSTPHSDVIDFLNHLVPAYKIGSGDLTNIPFLEKVARKCKLMILGTGMATLKEVKEALKAIYAQGGRQVVMLHCTTSYPCPIEDVNLRALQTMQKKLDCLVGYSDHTLGITVPIMAATLGAVVIEKHFTLDRTLPGPDHKASLEPHELKEMVEAIRAVEKALGSARKKPTNDEERTKKITRKSIVAKVNIPKGTVITKNMLAFKRPGTGIAPKNIHMFIGKKAKKNIKKDTFLTGKEI